MASASGEFTAYGISHWAAIAVFVAGAVLLVRLGRRQSPAQSRRFGRVVGAVTAAIYAVAVVYSMFPPSIERSVPLHLTDLATVVSAYAWWSQRHWAHALMYYWGLVLSVQALISQALRGPDFPHYQYLGFWFIHFVVVWGPSFSPGGAAFARTGAAIASRWR